MKRTSLIIFLMFVVLTLCVPFTAAQNGLTTKQFVYVTNQADNTISGYSINTSTGRLTEISGSPFDPGEGGVGPGPITADANGTHLYVVDVQQIPGVPSNCNDTNGVVQVLNVNQSTGALTHEQTANLPGVCGIDVAMDNAGKNLYVLMADTSAAIIAEFSVNPVSGRLTSIGTATVGSFDNPSQLVVDPSGKFVYTSNEGGVYLLPRNTSTGVLGTRTQVWDQPAQALAINNKALFVGITGFQSTNFIEDLLINNSTGHLKFKFSVNPAVQPAALDMTTNSNFLAAANGFDDNNVSNYAIASNGNFAEVTGSPFNSGEFPTALSFDLMNRYLYTANFGSNNISGYVLNSTTGDLTPIVGSPFPTGNNPAGIVVLQ